MVNTPRLFDLYQKWLDSTRIHFDQLPNQPWHAIMPSRVVNNSYVKLEEKRDYMKSMKVRSTKWVSAGSATYQNPCMANINICMYVCKCVCVVKFIPLKYLLNNLNFIYLSYKKETPSLKILGKNIRKKKEKIESCIEVTKKHINIIILRKNVKKLWNLECWCLRF